MMKPLPLLLALLLSLASSAGALKMSIWDRAMQTTLGAGESTGNKFNVQLVKNYSGPVVVLFSQTDDEKRTGTFQGLQNRYEGVLKNGELILMPPAKDDTPDLKSDLKPAPPPASPSAASAVQAGSIGITLNKLMQPFKLNVVVRTTNQSVEPPENAVQPVTTENVSPMTSKSIGTIKDSVPTLRAK